MSPAVPVMAQTQYPTQPVLLPAHTMIPAAQLAQSYRPSPNTNPSGPDPSTAVPVITQERPDTMVDPLMGTRISDPLPEGAGSSDDSPTEAVRTPDEVYGQTASDCFHEERNLLESV